MPDEPQVNPEERLDLLLQHLGTRPSGLGRREAERRLQQYGPNEIRRREERSHLRDLARQFTHPLALLLWAAAALAWIAGIVAVAIAIVVVIFVNAIFAFAQELQAERAVEALAAYLPSEARVLRDGEELRIPTTELVPGDVLLIEEGERISADARLLEGSLEIDMSTLTGESAPVDRDAEFADTGVPPLEARDLVFSGTSCVEGEARALVYATGMHTELGRIATLSQRVESEASPLENQVRKVAWLIALIAVVGGHRLHPCGDAGGRALDLRRRRLRRRAPGRPGPRRAAAGDHPGPRGRRQGPGAARRRGQAAERGRDPRVDQRDLHGQDRDPDREPDAGDHGLDPDRRPEPRERRDCRPTPGRTRRACGSSAAVMVACNNARPADENGEPVGDPTEVAILEAAASARLRRRR